MIEARGLTRRFGDVVAVNDVTLTVPQGAIFGFLGPNGSGKSTMVRMLTGILEPSAGDATIDGRSVRSSALEIKRRIGVVPEDLALFDSLTIWEHVTMAASIYGVNRGDTEARARQLLQYLDLWPARHTFVDQASYGMRKKCALAMAVVHNPKVLFLDEPFEGCDPAASRNIKDLLNLMTSRGATVFLTSHILEVVERLVHSFAVIVEGAVVCTSTTDEARQANRTLEEIYFEHVERAGREDFGWIG
jgi:ABC-2 type transport system ATP-binding protein